jgi:hypothetical protein
MAFKRGTNVFENGLDGVTSAENRKHVSVKRTKGSQDRQLTLKFRVLLMIVRLGHPLPLRPQLGRQGTQFSDEFVNAMSIPSREENAWRLLVKETIDLKEKCS